MFIDKNDFLQAISQALDFVEMDLFGVPTNHSKRIAFIAVRIGQQMKMSEEELFDIISLAMLHDNGASLKILHDGLRGNFKEKQKIIESMQEHCIIGEENISNFEFKTKPVNVIKYHHENHDGTGFFGMKGCEIPLMSQIIHLADKLDLEFDIKNVFDEPSSRDRVIDYTKKYKGNDFSPEVVDVFLRLAEQDTFWHDLTDEAITQALRINTPNFSTEHTYLEIRKMTKTFSKIIDAKSTFTQIHSSGLSEQVEKMAKFYNFDEDTTQQLLIAADLHDLGKLAVSNEILDKQGALTADEFDLIKKHPVVSKACLEGIKGFELIVQWIYQHHEKLDGSGYPLGLTGETLDFQSRLLTCLDIYQALTEDRPYRKAMNHMSAMLVLQEMAMKKLVDQQIVNDINQYYGLI